MRPNGAPSLAARRQFCTPGLARHHAGKTSAPNAHGTLTDFCPTGQPAPAILGAPIQWLDLQAPNGQTIHSVGGNQFLEKPRSSRKLRFSFRAFSPGRAGLREARSVITNASAVLATDWALSRASRAATNSACVVVNSVRSRCRLVLDPRSSRQCPCRTQRPTNQWRHKTPTRPTSPAERPGHGAANRHTRGTDGQAATQQTKSHTGCLLPKLGK